MASLTSICRLPLARPLILRHSLTPIRSFSLQTRIPRTLPVGIHRVHLQWQIVPSPSFWKETKRIFNLAKPETGLLVGAAGFCCMGKIMDFVMIQMGLKVADTELMHLMMSIPLEQLFGGLIGVFGVGAISNFGRIMLMRKAGERIIERLRNRIFDNIIRQDVRFFDENRTGEIISRLSADTVLVGKSITQKFLMVTMMAIIPPIAVAAIYYGRIVRKLSEQTQKATSDTTQEPRESKMYAKETHEVYKLSMKEAFATGTFYSSAGFAGNFVAMAILYYGGSLVADSVITPGELTSFFLYSTYVGFSMLGLSSFYGELMKGVGASSRLFTLLESRGTVQLSQGGKKLENNIAFAYPTRPDAPIFKDLSFTISPGTNVAVVGKSGSGKSSIAQLLLRFYDPDQGAIFIDGHDLQPSLFATTIRENIAYGRPDATDQEIEAAADQANALGFIQNFPGGFETYTGEKGVAMSGGQKQQPSILILDEATSALDASSEYLVQDAMSHIVQGRTVITIAHRLSTIQQADVVVVIEDGRVVEVGPYDELVEKADGKFRKLIEAQLSD
ncbi:P-loop containing nucleoside triphosphate hydrolase protein [Rhizoclosmatium globosum]|uniref:p-loop containing nucleoside triphosphate hydrolase protein n=1 Tax=Rhizoclosmatium globosum TaxID=329046 RepID=A0A1Y2CIA8_9FUNG|nr:P-loop containing nucleoside triphosphate hydrolase protein [Rhizoclosmatium globosum]|eukprot:ORY46769.1 P-loop containing nucleoside triphosphate hydrolase protein [Rhizoclosmatium globosum]